MAWRPQNGQEKSSIQSASWEKHPFWMFFFFFSPEVEPMFQGFWHSDYRLTVDMLQNPKNPWNCSEQATKSGDIMLFVRLVRAFVAVNGKGEQFASLLQRATHYLWVSLNMKLDSLHFHGWGWTLRCWGWLRHEPLGQWSWTITLPKESPAGRCASRKVAEQLSLFPCKI